MSLVKFTGKTKLIRRTKRNQPTRKKSDWLFYVRVIFETENWQSKSRPVTYFDLAQHVVQLLEKSSISNLKQETLNDPLFDYGMRLMKGTKEIGKLGKVKTALTKDFGIKQEIFYADLSTALLFKSANPKFVVQEFTGFRK